MAFNRRYAARRIQRAFRKYRGRRMMALAGRKARYVRRVVGVGNPTPTFVETYKGTDIYANVGGVFSARISDIPQVAQYNTLYKQYRINWVKVMLVPDWNSTAADHNAGQYNASSAIPSFAQARITYAINDSPQLTAPATEAVVLSDNGCKIKPIGSKWSCSFKPVPDVGVQSGTAGAGTIWTRQKYRQWFNFDLVTTGNNPEHFGISYFITQLLSGSPDPVKYNVYYKVSFTLRDPQ